MKFSNLFSLYFFHKFSHQTKFFTPQGSACGVTSKISVILTLVLFLVSVGCQTAPLTGRSQFILISTAEEIQLGITSYQEVLKDAKLSTDDNVTGMVKRVGARIAKVANRPDFEWEFNVIEDDEAINAFALPGGKVAVFTGILPFTKDEGGMATVIGHEVAHALARHGAERMSSGILAQIGLVGLNIALQNKTPHVIQSVNQAYGVGVNVGVLLPFNRFQESEADHMGLLLMAQAGYDPRAAIGFWERMSQSGKEKPPEFLSTHPADERRIKQIRNWIPEAMRAYNAVSPVPEL